MNITTHKSQTKSLKEGDPNFIIFDGMTIVPRAHLEISDTCPVRYRDIIAQCANEGWVKAVANITERELLFIGLAKE